MISVNVKQNAAVCPSSSVSCFTAMFADFWAVRLAFLLSFSPASPSSSDVRAPPTASKPATSKEPGYVHRTRRGESDNKKARGTVVMLPGFENLSSRMWSDTAVYIVVYTLIL